MASERGRRLHGVTVEVGMRLMAAILAALSALSSWGDTRREERGFPIINIYPQKIHHAGSQTFDVTQDPRGVLYFGNLAGVLTYDGAWWRLIKLPNEAAAFALESDSEGRVALGGFNEIGYLAPDAGGFVQYRSLMQEIPAEAREFGDVRRIVFDERGFFFLTEQFGIRWDGKSPPRIVVDLRRREKPPSRAFRAHGSIWLTGEEGAERLDPLTHNPAPVSAFAGKRVDLVLPFTSGSVVASVRGEGLFVVSGDSVTPFSPAASEWLKKKPVTDGIALPDGRLVLATRTDGVIIVTQSGQIEQMIDPAAGLPEEVLFSTFADREGILWLAHEGPIARLDLASPVSLLDGRRGLKGAVSSAVRYQDRLHVATSYGLYRLEPEPGGGMRGRRIEELPSATWSLLVGGDELLVSTTTGIHRLRGTSIVGIIPGTERFLMYAFARSEKDPSLYWIGGRMGLGMLRRTEQGWEFRPVPETPPYIASIVERGGVLYCGTVYDGVARIEDAMTGKPRVQTWGAPDEINVDVVDGQIVAVRATGAVFQIDPAKGLVPHPQFGKFSAPSGFFLLEQNGRGDIWINSSPPRLFRKEAAGRWSAEGEPLVQIEASDIQFMNVDELGVAWFGSDMGLFRYAAESTQLHAKQPAPLLGRIVVGDRLLHGGWAKPDDDTELPHNFRRLRIEFAPGSFRPGVLYQYRLDPIDADWSDWTDQTFIDYTNLVEGTYRFRLRSRGAAAATSPEAQWAFTVLAPWYRTTWALLLWFTLAAIVVFIVVKVRTRALHHQADLLQQKIEERTEELRQTVDRLRHTQDELVLKNEKLEQLTLVDELTGVANRRYFQRALTDEWNRARRRDQSLGLIIVDIDHFKELNDTRGHPAGDECLREVGEFLSKSIRRAGDVVARYGGEEFVILLPATTTEQATFLAEMVRIGIERLAIPNHTTVERFVTVSCGVAATVPAVNESMEGLIERADRALYDAKHAGRNRVCVATEPATA